MSSMRRREEDKVDADGADGCRARSACLARDTATPSEADVRSRACVSAISSTASIPPARSTIASDSDDVSDGELDAERGSRATLADGGLRARGVGRIRELDDAGDANDTSQRIRDDNDDDDDIVVDTDDTTSERVTL